jgi:dihydroorotate dehydrogenase
MGMYRRLVRPVAFAFEPETAHRVATSVLRWPLPWRAIGGAADDPLLRTELAGVRLRNPVGLAAGFDKDLRCLRALGELGFGFVVGGTLTRRPRAGNRRPRIVRRPEASAMVNSMGLPNPGVAVGAARLRAARRSSPVFLSLADEAREDVVAAHALLEPLADAIELNASCPNVDWGRDRDTEEHLRELTRELAMRGRKPLFVKLPPFRDEAGRAAVAALAGIAAEAGASAITFSNSLPVPEAGLAMGRGGLTGRPLFRGTVEGIRAIHEAVAGGVPIVACGGIFSADDALACLDAGASAVQVYTAFIYEGPGLVGEMTRGLASRLRARAEGSVAYPVAR